MPVVIDTDRGPSRNFDVGSNGERKAPPADEYTDRYPVKENGQVINLHTNDNKMHAKILDMVLRRARESERWIGRRHSDWRKISKQMTAYIPLDDEEKKIKDKDERRPTSIVIPEMYASREVLLTYMLAAFGVNPTFSYEGVGPEDTYGAILLELLIQQQVRRGKALIPIHSQLSDAFTYGVGIVTPTWETRIGQRMVVDDIFEINALGQQIKVGSRKDFVETITFEGTVLDVIDPFLYLPDPNVPIHQPQKGEFVGWLERTSYMSLLRRENSPDSPLFNVKHLRGKTMRSSVYRHDDSGRNDFSKVTDQRHMEGDTTQAIDVIWEYIDLIPKEHGLGSRESPQTWLFGVAGDEVVVGAHPMGLNSNMFPVGVAAPDYGGHELAPIARMELMFGLQEVINFFYNSHVSNVRKSLNDMFLVDPRLVNMKDVLAPRDGKVIRTRAGQWGRGVQNVMEQLKVVDVTQNNIRDVQIAQSMGRDLTGTVDSVKGVQRTGGERVTAEEFRDTRAGALSRLQKAARVISLQSMEDVALMYAYNTLQFMEEDTYVKTIGRWEETLRLEYGKETHVSISPFDLDIAFDIIPHDGSIAGSQSVEQWNYLYGLVIGNPELFQTLDTTKIFMHIARLLGEKNVQDFARKAPALNRTSTEDVEAGIQSGNLQPLGA